MSRANAEVVAALGDAIRAELSETVRRPVVIGICGAQGSGKSTLADAMLEWCGARGIAAATLSIDDLYLTKAERQELSATVHPLLATRGPPGTHDVALGLEVFEALRRGEPAALTRFDKARDDRVPATDWPRAPANCQVLLFEGWCVGAVPQSGDALREPINELERTEDAEGAWRGYVNAALRGAYRRLFAALDRLVLLAAPGFDVVYGWRLQQERELQSRAAPDAEGVMDEAAIARFIQHYERLTRHILAEMPERADILVRLDEHRKPLEIRVKASH